MVRFLIVAALLVSLQGCAALAAVPVAAWTAIAAGAGTATAIITLDDHLIQDYEAAKKAPVEAPLAPASYKN